MKRATIASFVLIFSMEAALVQSVMNYKIAVVFEVGHDWSFDIHRTGPAIDIGKEKLQEIIGDKINVTFVEVFQEVNYHQCTRKYFGSIAAKLYHNRDVNGFFGPGMFFLFIYRNFIHDISSVSWCLYK